MSAPRESGEHRASAVRSDATPRPVAPPRDERGTARMYPILDLRFVELRTFGLLAVCALLAAFAFAERRARAAGLARWTMIAGVVAIVGCAWIAARIVPMIVSPREVFADPRTFFRGLLLSAGAWYGGLAGGILGL